MPESTLENNSRFTVKDLDANSWTDFERFFSKYNGVQAGCWCMYYHRTGVTPGKTIEEKIERNHTDKRELVLANKSRGILIYDGVDVIASCQYGTRSELPRIDNGWNYKALEMDRPVDRFWRITCFFVDKAYRRRGLARFALRATLEKIKELGGGIVEAYPVTNHKALRIWFGTVNMYEKEGFEQISQLGRSNAVMQKVL